MQINDDVVLKIARLARIDLQNHEIGEMQAKLNSIFNWINQLNDVDIDKIEPLFNVTLEQMPVRLDQITDGNVLEAILANAPDIKHAMFSVPKVVE